MKNRYKLISFLVIFFMSCLLSHISICQVELQTLSSYAYAENETVSAPQTEERDLYKEGSVKEKSEEEPLSKEEFLKLKEVIGETEAKEVRKLPPKRQRALYEEIVGKAGLLKVKEKKVAPTPKKEIYKKFFIPRKEFLIKKEKKPLLLKPKKLKRLKRFGEDLFNASVSTFAPIQNVPVGPDYVIAPGDSLIIHIWGKIFDRVYSCTVDPSGKILIPKFGEYYVWGMKYGEINRFMRKKFKKYFKDFSIDITMGKLRSIQVYLIGEVKKPGTYTLSSLSTVINALFVSGGPKNTGSMRKISLRRGGKEIAKLDLYNLLLYGKMKGDKRLLNGDIIFVPVVGESVSVLGEVKRPAIYELKGGETLSDLLFMAGGMTPKAYKDMVQVERILGEKKIIIDVKKSDFGSFHLKDGDKIYVKKIYDVCENRVYVIGNVKRPGGYQWKKGMKVLDLINLCGGFVESEETYLARADLIRLLGKPKPFKSFVELLNQPTKREIIHINLYDLISGKKSENIELVPFDTLRIYRRDEVLPTFYVTIEGCVRKPGDYPLTSNMKISDLIMEAGGLTDDAYYLSAELTREVREKGMVRQSGLEIKRFNIDLILALKGDPKNDMKLFPNDHLLVKRVPNYEVYRKVSIKGEVKFPGVYTVKKGEKLSSLIKRAGGFTKDAFLKGAVFTRESVRLVQRRALKKFILEQEKVLISLETKAASEPLESSEKQSIMQTVKMRRDLLKKLSKMELPGRMFIDLEAIFSKKKKKRRFSLGSWWLMGEETYRKGDFDITLEDGDSLYIPETPDEINIIGEVFSPGGAIYMKDRKLSYYLDQVGGLTPDADKSRIYIIRADGRAISQKNLSRFRSIFSQKIERGDTIFIPRKIVVLSKLGYTKEIVDIFYKTVVTLGVVANLF